MPWQPNLLLVSLANSHIDINCDLGEIDPSFELEKSIMPLINRCNIAAGGHAGNNQSIKQVMILADQHKVKIGIHPSFPDKENFGRVKMVISDEALLKELTSQILSFIEIADACNIEIDHIKAHGALYHYVAHDLAFAKKYLDLVNNICPELKVLIPPHSEIIKLIDDYPLDYLIEAFADRRYNLDGKLQSRKVKGSVIEDIQELLKQVDSIVTKQGVHIADQFLSLKANSICVHSDTSNSVKALEAIKRHFV